MDHCVPPAPNILEQKLATFSASMLPIADSTNERNLFSNLKQINNLIAHLYLERSYLNRAINRHCSPIIHNLPQDVLTVVFSFCLPDHTKFYTSLSKYDLSAPLILGAVCKDWREIAWSNPRLWCTMAINISSSKTNFESQTSLAREWLSRSGRLPLSIRIVWAKYNPSFSPVFASLAALVNNESSRWHTFHLSATPKIYDIFGGPNFSAPILESLHVHANRFPDITITEDSTFGHFLLPHCPCLREIRLTDISTRLIKVPTDGITRIYATGLPIIECRGIIRRMPLVYCELMAVQDGEFDSDSAPLSTNLKEFAVHISSKEESFLKNMKAPCLETFTLQTDDDYCLDRIANTLHSFVIHSRCSLHTFSLVGDQHLMHPMISLLEAMPTLRNFTVSTFRRGSEIVLEIFARIITSQGKPTKQDFLPNIETLTFTGDWNFRSDQVSYVSPIGPCIPSYIFQRPLRSVTFEFQGPVRYLPEKVLFSLLALREYGITLNTASSAMKDLIQPSLDFYKEFRMRPGYGRA